MTGDRDATTERVWQAIVNFLQELHDAALQPLDARRRLRQFREEHPGIHMELVADEEAFGPSYHYDLLIRLGEQESITLSYCHDHGIPWAMRGARRWTERDLLRVNDVVLRIDEVLSCMEFDCNDHSSMQSLINMAILREALEREFIPVSPEELQQAMDTFRQSRGLYRAADTYAWLQERGISHVQLEEIVYQQALAAALRARVTAPDIEPYFQDHRSDFDGAVVAIIEYCSEPAACEDANRIRRGELDFYAAAEANSQRESAAGASRTNNPATIGRRYRGSLPPELATHVFSAAAGEVVGPIRCAGNWAVAKIVAFIPASLDHPTRQMIEGILFEHWLEKQRASARIEWYWGNVQQTRNASVSVSCGKANSATLT